MAEQATVTGVEGARVLEIGGGVGKLQAELVKAGAASGEIVELVPTYERYARELAQAAGIDERTAFRVVDILENPQAVEPAHIVLLSRVVCCSPDGVELTAEASRHTRRVLVLSYPREIFLIRAVVGVQNLAFRLLRRTFRVFVHSPGAIVAAAESAGLQLADRAALGVWEVAVLRRPS